MTDHKACYSFDNCKGCGQEEQCIRDFMTRQSVLSSLERED